MIIVNSNQLASIFDDMAVVGSANFVKSIMPGKDQVSQCAAFNEFGRSRVMRWVKDGSVKPVKSGRSVNYSRADLLKASKTESMNKMNFERYETEYM
jgi:hypothetical protein